jgi:hypothetical protein
MQDITDRRHPGRRNVGETNPPEMEKKSGFPGYVAAQLGMWSVVILVALVFIVVIAIFAF